MVLTIGTSIMYIGNSGLTIGNSIMYVGNSGFDNGDVYHVCWECLYVSVFEGISQSITDDYSDRETVRGCVVSEHCLLWQADVAVSSAREAAASSIR